MIHQNQSINNWFSPENEHLQKSEVSPSVQNSGLSPNTLLRNEEILNNEIISLDSGSDEPIKRLQFSGGGNLFSMTLHEQKVLSNVELSCWHGCNNKTDETLKLEPLVAAKAFGLGSEVDLTLMDLNIHVSHMSTVEESNNEVTSIGFTLGDDDPQDEFVVDFIMMINLVQSFSIQQQGNPSVHMSQEQLLLKTQALKYLHIHHSMFSLMKTWFLK